MRKHQLTRQEFSQLANWVVQFRRGQSMDDELGHAYGAPSECYTDMHNANARSLRRRFKGIRGGVEAYNRMLEDITTKKFAYFSGLEISPDELMRQRHEWQRRGN